MSNYWEWKRVKGDWDAIIDFIARAGDDECPYPPEDVGTLLATQRRIADLEGSLGQLAERYDAACGTDADSEEWFALERWLDYCAAMVSEDMKEHAAIVARREYDHEVFREEVESLKARFRAKKPLIPWRIKLVRIA